MEQDPSEQAQWITDRNQFRSMARHYHRNFWNFLKDMWSHVPTSHGEPSLNFHMKYMCDELQLLGEWVINKQPKEYDLLINVPPGSSKSTIATILFPVWIWTQAPWARIISGSNEGRLSMFQSQMSRDVINSDYFQLIYGDLVIMRKDQDTKGLYMNLDGGFRMSTSTGANITGQHGHLIIVDDPINPKGVQSKKIITGASQWINTTLSTRKVDKANTPMVMIMQRLHEADPAGDWIKKSKDGKIRLKHICLPSTSEFPVHPSEDLVTFQGNEMTLSEWYEHQGGFLDPTRAPGPVLEDEKGKLGSRGYSEQYGQATSAPEGNEVKLEWLKVVPYNKLPEQVKNLVKDYTVDAADKTKQANDPTAFLCYATYKGYLFVFDYMTIKETFGKRVEALKGFVAKNGNRGRIFIEPKSSGVAITQYLQESTTLNVLEWKMAEGDKLARLRSISPNLEAGKCFLVQGPWNDDFIHEMTVFPNAEHDEAVDTLTMAGVNTWNRGVVQGYEYLG
jgi:predicted phage terminase large subunit-like protein